MMFGCVVELFVAIAQVDASMMSYIVTNLSVTNNYTIRVVAILSGGIEGPSSAVHSFTTMRDTSGEITSTTLRSGVLLPRFSLKSNINGSSW